MLTARSDRYGGRGCRRCHTVARRSRSCRRGRGPLGARRGRGRPGEVHIGTDRCEQARRLTGVRLIRAQRTRDRGRRPGGVDEEPCRRRDARLVAISGVERPRCARHGHRSGGRGPARRRRRARRRQDDQRRQQHNRCRQSLHPCSLPALAARNGPRRRLKPSCTTKQGTGPEGCSASAARNRRRCHGNDNGRNPMTGSGPVSACRRAGRNVPPQGAAVPASTGRRRPSSTCGACFGCGAMTCSETTPLPFTSVVSASRSAEAIDTQLV